mmetsp:Transcript_9223/g.14276  ORF Transcript_9223/g.14276 Transcript_9223/m.14276 type:complete len:84 (+) Transcript_9223:942-1193(+)
MVVVVGAPMTSTSGKPHIILFEDIKRITNHPSFDAKLIEAIAKGYQDFSSGKFNLCPIQTIGAPPNSRVVSAIETRRIHVTAT